MDIEKNLFMFNAPLVHGPVPGKESQKLLDAQARIESTAITYPRNLTIAIRRASGSFIEDMDGNNYIDFLTGAGVLSLGHNHPELVSEAITQMYTLCHSLDFPTPIKQQFTEQLIDLLPETLKSEMRVHFCGPTGADAVETAIKLAKTHTQRDEVIAFHGSYHGCTNAAMSVTSLKAPKENIGNLMPGVNFFPYPYCFRCPLGLAAENCETNCLSYLENMLRDGHGGIKKPAAVIIEPVQGEGGTIPATKNFMQRLRSLTEELGILLIVDEVQSGIGRTGKWFAFEYYDIEPDIIVSSKALSGMGSPISVIMYRKKYQWKKGAHIGTFRGNQVAMATGVKALQIMRQNNILDNVKQMSQHFLGLMEESLQKNSLVGDIRGLGLMLGIEMVDPLTRQPNGVLARKVQKTCLENGLIVELGGRDDAVIRLLPPLNISQQVLGRAAEILIHAIHDAVAQGQEAEHELAEADVSLA